jgi:hypothetical protein
MCFWNDTKTGNRPFVSRGPGMLMGVAATCRNKARACGIAILLGLGVLWCCCCIFQSGDTGGNSQGMAGMDGRSQTTPTTEHARKKSVGRGLDRRCVSSFLSAVADAIFVSLWTGLFWPAMGLQMLGEKRPAFSGCPALPLYGSSAHLYSRSVSKR